MSILLLYIIEALMGQVGLEHFLIKVGQHSLFCIHFSGIYRWPYGHIMWFVLLLCKEYGIGVNYSSH